MADDLKHLIEREGLQRPVVLGHSMGGKTAMALALMYPERVGRLIVVDIAPVGYADRLSPFAEALRSVDTLAAASRSEVARRLAEALPDAGVVPFLMQTLVMRNAHFDWRINLAAITASIPRLSAFPPELRGLRFDRPLQVIAGGRSDYVVRRDGADYRPMFTRLQLDFLEEAGHWVHADAPRRFLELVSRSLGSASRHIPAAADAAA